MAKWRESEEKPEARWRETEKSGERFRLFAWHIDLPQKAF
jgi:hypothetical protein